jgi:hypothetical protein
MREQQHCLSTRRWHMEFKPMPPQPRLPASCTSLLTQFFFIFYLACVMQASI